MTTINLLSNNFWDNYKSESKGASVELISNNWEWKYILNWPNENELNSPFKQGLISKYNNESGILHILKDIKIYYSIDTNCKDTFSYKDKDGVQDLSYYPLRIFKGTKTELDLKLANHIRGNEFRNNFKGATTMDDWGAINPYISNNLIRHSLKKGDVIFFRGDNNNCKIEMSVEYEKGYSINTDIPSFPDYWPRGFVNTEYCQGKYDNYMNDLSGNSTQGGETCGGIHYLIYRHALTKPDDNSKSIIKEYISNLLFFVKFLI